MTCIKPLPTNPPIPRPVLYSTTAKQRTTNTIQILSCSLELFFCTFFPSTLCLRLITILSLTSICLLFSVAVCLWYFFLSFCGPPQQFFCVRWSCSSLWKRLKEVIKRKRSLCVRKACINSTFKWCWASRKSFLRPSIQINNIFMNWKRIGMREEGENDTESWKYSHRTTKHNRELFIFSVASVVIRFGG